MSRFYLILKFTLLFIIIQTTTFAQSAKPLVNANRYTSPALEIYDEQNQLVPWQKKIEPMFQVNEEQAEVFSFKLSAKLDRPIESAILDQGAVIKIENAVLRAAIYGMRSSLTIKFMDGTTANYRVELKYQKVQLINRNCNTKSFAINIPAIKDSFYIAASCREVKGSIQASITIPQELNWGASTVFETAGKGERWKLFNFNQLNLSNKTGEIGRITVLKEGVQTPCLITFLPGTGNGTGEQKTPEVVKRKQSLVRVPLGVSQNSVKNEDLTASGLGYLLSFEGKFFPEKSRWVLNGKYKNVLSSAADGQSLSLFQAGAGYLLGKEFGSGTSYLALLNFDSFSSQAPKAKVNIVHSQVGVNFFILNFDSKTRGGWSLEFYLSGYLPKADSQMMGLEFNYMFSSAGIGKGIFLNYLSENFEYKKTSTAETKSKIQSSQIQAGILLHF